MLFSGAFDQLTGWNPHNYFLYHDGKHDRWRYLPWDLDVGFCATAFGKIRVLADWHAAWPVPAGGAPNPLLERIVADPVLLARYRKEARTVLDTSFEPERLCKALDAKYGLIREDLKADPFPHRRATVPSDRSYDDVVDSMRAFVRKRYASAVAQLEIPGERPRGQPRPSGPSPQLAGKVQRIQKRVQEMQRDGRDVTPVVQLMQRFGPAVEAGNFAEAERIADAALKVAGEKGK
jgi:spore coat protein CotH